MEMQPFEAVQFVRLKISKRYPQAGAGGAGIVNRVLLLGMLGVYAQPAGDGSARRADPIPETAPLSERIEYDMVTDFQQLVKFIIPVGGGVDVHLTAHFLMAEPCLEQRACGSAAEIPADQRIQAEHRKTLLRQQNAAARAFRHRSQQFEVFRKQALIHKIAGGGNQLKVKFHRQPS